MPASTHSSQFIGRYGEVRELHRLLHQGSEGPSIIHICGDGGIGKTWLLSELRTILQNEYPDVVTNPEIVDFYFTANQHEFGVLQNIARQLGASCFVPFGKAVERYQREMAGFTPLTPDFEKELQDSIHKRFIECLQTLSHQNRIVLVCDTVEEAGEAIADLARILFPKLKGRVLLIVAGRGDLNLDRVDPQEVEIIQLKGFEFTEAVEYFRQRGYTADDLSDEEIERLRKRSDEGTPILMALVAELLERYPVSDLLKLDEKQLPIWLVERVTDLGRFENQAILYIAHCWRRFNSSILELLSGESYEECQETVRSLGEQLFVKYRPSQMGQPDSCLLHDKMRDLINYHIWPAVDRDGNLRRELSSKMSAYYEQALRDSQDPIEQRVLRCEQIYYHFGHDLTIGFLASRQEFELRSHRRDVGFIAAINAEVDRYLNKLPPEYQREHQFRLGWLAFQRERHGEAIRIWESLWRDRDTSERVKAKSMTYLVEAYADNSEFDEAERSGQSAIKLIERQAQKASTDQEKSEILQEQGLVYNNLGYVRRKQERWQQAIDYYTDALNCGGPLWQVARIRNNLGYVLNLLGRSELAFSHCQVALRIREKLDAPYELGLSYNTLGILCVDNLRIGEAERHFQSAIMAFEQAQSKRGRALVNTALGRLYRQWGWYDEHVVGKGFDRERSQYVDAIKFSKEAVEIFDEVGDEAGLAEAQEELGCAYRERREWRQAIDTLTDAINVARKKVLRRREADILQDLSITYWRVYLWSEKSEDNLRKAENYAQQAVDRITAAEAQADRAGTDTVAAGFPYLLSKAQWTLGDIKFERQQYPDAFHRYAEASVNVTRLDPRAISHDSAKKKLHYEDLVKHVVNRILALSDQQTVASASETLLVAWEKAGLSEEYPGFVENIEAACKDYELLREGNEGAPNA